MKSAEFVAKNTFNVYAGQGFVKVWNAYESHVYTNHNIKVNGNRVTVYNYLYDYDEAVFTHCASIIEK